MFATDNLPTGKAKYRRMERPSRSVRFEDALEEDGGQEEEVFAAVDAELGTAEDVLKSVEAVGRYW